MVKLLYPRPALPLEPQLGALSAFSGRTWRAACLSQVGWRSLRWLAGKPLVCPGWCCLFRGRAGSLVCSRGHALRAPLRCAGPPPFSSTPLIRIDRIYACLERYSKLKELERRLHDIDTRIRGPAAGDRRNELPIGLSMYREGVCAVFSEREASSGVFNEQ